MRRHEVAGDGQAQPGAWWIGPPCEAVEGAREQVRREPRPGIGDRHDDAGHVDVRPDGHRHGATRRRLADSIGEEAADDLRDADGIRLDRKQVVRDVRVEAHAAPSSLGLATGHGIQDQGPDVERLAAQLEISGLRLGDRAQIVDQALERGRGIEDRCQVRLVRRVDAVDDGLHVAADDGQWRSQLMGHVGKEAASLLLGRCQARMPSRW